MRKLYPPFLLGIMLLVFSIMVSSGQAKEPLQTQPSSDGKLEASLLQAKVGRETLNLRISLKNISGALVEPSIGFGQIYYADIKGKKKYYGLKDSKGIYLAGPQHYNWGGGTFKDRIPPGETRIIWIKFPAPPKDTETIDVFIPGILPFEAVALKDKAAKE